MAMMRRRRRRRIFSDDKCSTDDNDSFYGNLSSLTAITLIMPLIIPLLIPPLPSSPISFLTHPSDPRSNLPDTASCCSGRGRSPLQPYSPLPICRLTPPTSPCQPAGVAEGRPKQPARSMHLEGAVSASQACSLPFHPPSYSDTLPPTSPTNPLLGVFFSLTTGSPNMYIDPTLVTIDGLLE